MSITYIITSIAISQLSNNNSVLGKYVLSKNVGSKTSTVAQRLEVVKTYK